MAYLPKSKYTIKNTPGGELVYKSDNKNYIASSHIDERSAGFFGLGISKGSNLPTIVITTSGTATANLLPAIIESSLSKTPLIVITADRPEYLIDKGENQTINQQQLYGSHVRFFSDSGLPIDKFDYLLGDEQKKLK